MTKAHAVTGWFFGLLLVAAGPALGQNFEQMAKQIVQTSARVKAGDAVVITGGQHTLPLMEAVAVEVARAGGQPTLLVTTDKIERAINVDMPEAAIQASKSDNWLLQADVLITLPQYENGRAVLQGMTPARDARFARANAESGFEKKLDASKLRGVFVSYPSKSFAANQHLDYPGYEQMVWAGISADYAAIAAQAQQLKQMLAAGHKLHITSPSGTDLTLQLGGRPVFADDGVVSAADQQEKLIFNRVVRLPGGLVSGSCEETSATGQLAAATTTLNGQPLKGFKAELKNGRLTNVRADEGIGSFQEWLAPFDPSVKQISAFSIGLNPVMKPQDQKGFNPGTAAGMVYLSMGGNALQGGQNHATTSYSFPIASATVEVDGKTIVRNGQLVSSTVASAESVRKKAK